MKTINLEVPFFPGFYDSWMEDGDTGYYESLEFINEYKDAELDVDSDIEFDYTTRRKDITALFIEKIMDYMPDYVLSIKNDYVESPQYYNYSTDRLFADFEFEDDWKTKMCVFMNENEDWLKEKIHKDWRSRDGFISFMSNDFNEWYENLFNKEDELYISTMIGYQMIKMLGSAETLNVELSTDVLECISDYDYISLTDSGKEKVNTGEEAKNELETI